MSFIIPPPARPFGAGSNLEITGIVSAAKLATKSKIDFNNGSLVVNGAVSPSTLQFVDSAGTTGTVGVDVDIESVLTNGNNANTLSLLNIGNLTFQQNIRIGTVSGAATASGYNAIAIGYGSSTTGNRAIAMGYNSAASYYDTIAIGNGATASGYMSIALGRSSEASGFYAVAIGASSEAATSTVAVGRNAGNGAGQHSVCIGFDSSVYNSNCVAVGRGAYCSANDSIAIGRSTGVSGTGSISIGRQILNYNDFSVAIGDNAYIAHDRAVMIGGNMRSKVADEFGVIGLRHVYGTVNTTDNTTTTLATFPLVNTSDYALVNVYVSARRTNNANETFGSYAAAPFLVMNKAGTVTTEPGSVTFTDHDPDAVGYTVAVDVSGTTLRVRVTGATSHNVTWRGSIVLYSVVTY